MRRLPVLCAALLAAFLSPVLQAELPTATVERSRQPDERLLDGVVEAVHGSTMSAQTSGQVEALLVDVGDVVPAGAAIVRLRDLTQRSEVDRAEAAVREAQARLLEARNEWQRLRSMRDRQLLAQAPLDSAHSAVEAAQARLDAAQAEQARARELLSYTTVFAPYGGVVTARHVQIGESVVPGQPLLSGVSLQALRVISHLPGHLAEAVRQRAQAQVLTGNASSLTPVHLRVYPSADAASGAFTVRLDLPPDTPGLYPGSRVKVAFVIGERDELTVPASAIARHGEQELAYVVDASGVHLRTVRSGRHIGNRLIVQSGLAAGERVAVDPAAAVRAVR